MTPQAPNFDRVARLYRWAEYLTLGPLLQRTRNHHLAGLTHCHRALVLGDGDGRFLAQLLRVHPHLEAFAVDTSATMLHLLRNRCAFAADRLRTQRASALTFAAPPGTDLIVTHFLLDCFTQPEIDALAQRLAPQLASGALWLVSDFAVPSVSVLRTLASLYIRALYLAFRILTGLRTTCLPDPQAALARAGFTRIAHHERLLGLLYTDLWRRRETNC